MFCGFLIAYLVRELEVMGLEGRLAEEKRLMEGVLVAEKSIRNQIILINQATYELETWGEYDEEIVRGIRENTLRMDRQLGLLQSEGPSLEVDDDYLVLF